MKGLISWAGLVVFSAGALGMDVSVYRGLYSAVPVEREDSPATQELFWDNGQRRAYIAFTTGAGTWFGNDFDISTFSEYRTIRSISVYSNPLWPNRKWDGFRLGIYDFTGGKPGWLFWGPRFALPTRRDEGWCNFSVDWVLPPPYSKFIAALEQFYGLPDCDPHVVDGNLTFLEHSWQYYQGRWTPLAGGLGYRNLMLRVVVAKESVTVSPTSIGRVKALYY